MLGRTAELAERRLIFEVSVADVSSDRERFLPHLQPPKHTRAIGIAWRRKSDKPNRTRSARSAVQRISPIDSIRSSAELAERNRTANQRLPAAAVATLSASLSAFAAIDSIRWIASSSARIFCSAVPLACSACVSDRTGRQECSLHGYSVAGPTAPELCARDALRRMEHAVRASFTRVCSRTQALPEMCRWLRSRAAAALLLRAAPHRRAPLFERR